jgi:hypothetical protein
MVFSFSVCWGTVVSTAIIALPHFKINSLKKKRGKGGGMCAKEEHHYINMYVLKA